MSAESGAVRLLEQWCGTATGDDELVLTHRAEAAAYAVVSWLRQEIDTA